MLQILNTLTIAEVIQQWILLIQPKEDTIKQKWNNSENIEIKFPKINDLLNMLEAKGSLENLLSDFKLKFEGSVKEIYKYVSSIF